MLAVPETAPQPQLQLYICIPCTYLVSLWSRFVKYSMYHQSFMHAVTIHPSCYELHMNSQQATNAMHNHLVSRVVLLISHLPALRSVIVNLTRRNHPSSSPRFKSS